MVSASPSHELATQFTHWPPCTTPTLKVQASAPALLRVGTGAGASVGTNPGVERADYTLTAEGADGKSASVTVSTYVVRP